MAITVSCSKSFRTHLNKYSRKQGGSESCRVFQGVGSRGTENSARLCTGTLALVSARLWVSLKKQPSLNPELKLYRAGATQGSWAKLLWGAGPMTILGPGGMACRAGD